MTSRFSSGIACCVAERTLIRNFGMCTYPVKKHLFTAYCATVYCVHLWRMYSAAVIRKFKVCLNNAVRIFFGYDRVCSVSAMYVSKGLDNFDVMFRKAAWRFVQRLYDSKNIMYWLKVT